MYWELFRSMSGVDMLHVPYRGGGPALTDLLGGQVQAFFSTLISSIQYIRDGKLRPARGDRIDALCGAPKLRGGQVRSKTGRHGKRPVPNDTLGHAGERHPRHGSSHDNRVSPAASRDRHSH
jgi:hypothetical protein